MTNKEFFLKVIKYLFVLLAWLLCMILSGVVGYLTAKDENHQEKIRMELRY